MIRMTVGEGDSVEIDPEKCATGPNEQGEGHEAITYPVGSRVFCSIVFIFRRPVDD
jgi:hypothetical protein